MLIRIQIKLIYVNVLHAGVSLRMYGLELQLTIMYIAPAGMTGFRPLISLIAL